MVTCTRSGPNRRPYPTAAYTIESTAVAIVGCRARSVHHARAPLTASSRANGVHSRS